MLRLSVPLEILSDRGSNFLSSVMKEPIKFLGILHSKTAPYRPQSNEAVERFHHTLMQMVRKSVADHRDWDEHLQYLLLACREAPCSSTGFSPLELLFGCEVHGPLDILRQQWVPAMTTSTTVTEWLLKLRTDLTKMSALAINHQENTQARTKAWFDRSTTATSFHKGDLFSFVTVYIDDISVFSPSWMDHLAHLRQVFDRLRDEGLTIQSDKSQIGMTTCQFLGHTVGLGTITPQEAKLVAIRNYPQPSTKTGVRLFLGMTDYYHHFIPHFSSVAAPLTDLTKKAGPVLLSGQLTVHKLLDTSKNFFVQAQFWWHPTMQKRSSFRPHRREGLERSCHKMTTQATIIQWLSIPRRCFLGSKTTLQQSRRAWRWWTRASISFLIYSVAPSSSKRTIAP